MYDPASTLPVGPKETGKLTGGSVNPAGPAVIGPRTLRFQPADTPQNVETLSSSSVCAKQLAQHNTKVQRATSLCMLNHVLRGYICV